MNTTLIQPDRIFDAAGDVFVENTPASIVRAFSPSVADFLQDAISLISDETTNGLLTFESGTISGTITTPDSSLNVLIETTDFFSTLIDQAAMVSGSATLVNGIFNADISVDGIAYGVMDEDISAFLDTTLNRFLMQAEDTFAFSEGSFNFEGSGLLGDFLGTLGFGDGQLALDLETPLGDFVVTLPFPDNAILPFDAFGNPGTINFAQGDVLVSLFGTEVAIPISSLSGAVSLSAGTAVLNVATPFGPVNTELELGPIASELVETFTEDVSADISITDGIVSGLLTTPFGELNTDFSLIELANTAFEIATATTGTIGIADGQVVVDLDTPNGALETTFTGTELDTFLSTPLLELV